MGIRWPAPGFMDPAVTDGRPVTPEVSVVMSCYNASRWLAESVDSVLSQSHGSLELVLIDNGSTDETLRIIRDMEDSDARVIGLSKQGSGLAESLNLGIDRSRGKWIARLDADDVCEPTRLERQLDLFRRHPELTLTGTGCVEIDEHGRFLKQHRYPPHHNRLLSHLEHMQRFFPHSSAMYRADAVREVGRYRNRFGWAEDWDLWLRLASVGQVECLREPLVRIRKHPAQMSLDDSGRRQFVDTTAAIICHLLRIDGRPDLADSAESHTWDSFLQWIDRRLDDAGAFKRRSAYHSARSQFLASGNRWFAAIAMRRYILSSGHARALMTTKLGFGLPRRLAHEWAKGSGLGRGQ